MLRDREKCRQNQCSRTSSTVILFKHNKFKESNSLSLNYDSRDPAILVIQNCTIAAPPPPLSPKGSFTNDEDDDDNIKNRIMIIIIIIKIIIILIIITATTIMKKY